MSLIKRNPGSLIPALVSDFFDVDKFFNTDLSAIQQMPAVNIKENGKNFKVELSAPGFEKKDFKISVEDDVLTVSAEKEEEKNEENERYTRQEFVYNSFSRSFSLPKSARNDVEAHYENGILKLTIPKKEEDKARARKEVAVS